MITGYSSCGMIPEAFVMVSLMHRTGVKLNETTFSMALSACGRAQSLSNGKQIQGDVLIQYIFKTIRSLKITDGCKEYLSATSGVGEKFLQHLQDHLRESNNSLLPWKRKNGNSIPFVIDTLTFTQAVIFCNTKTEGGLADSKNA